MESRAYFSPFSEIEVSQNRLPHWQQQSGGTYFLTWRLADSVPRRVLDEFEEERSEWLDQHPHPWTEAIEQEYHARFSREMDRFLDQNWGSCILRNRAHAREVGERLLFDPEKRNFVHSFVVMPNHVHALISFQESVSLSQWVKSCKGIAARNIRRAHRGRLPSVWQKDYFDRLIRDASHFANCVRYIRRNPEKARLRSGFLFYESETAQSIP